MSGALKLILEMGGESESEDSVECPKCGCMCDSEDKYCCECGAKMPAPAKAVAAARKGALSKMVNGTEED
jgi:transposase